jgi:hypothetical protein
LSHFYAGYSGNARNFYGKFLETKKLHEHLEIVREEGTPVLFIDQNWDGYAGVGIR